MELTPVTSHHIAAIGHDELTGVLTVQFKNGATYEYDDVPRERYEVMLGADSAGTYLHNVIKPNHPGRRI